MLRDRIVCGVRDKRLQQRLLAKPDLNFEKARELAIAACAEAATRNSQDLQASQTSSTSPGGEPVSSYFRSEMRYGFWLLNSRL